MLVEFKKYLPWNTVYVPRAGEIDNPPPTPLPPTPLPVPPTPDAPKFTQAQVDEMINKRFKKEKETTERTIADLNKYKETAGLSEKQIQELSQKVEELQNLTLSKEELAKKEVERLQKAAEKEKGTLSADRDLYKSLYTESQIESALGSAASDPEIKALSPKQITMLLKNQTRLVAKEVGGKQKFEVAVDWNETDSTGNTTTIQIPPKEALKRMKEQPATWGNLFESDAKGGLGSATVQSNGSLNPASYATPDDYRKNRAQIVG